LKNPKKCLIIYYAPDKKIFPGTFRIKGTLVFLCLKEREKERVRARAREKKKAKEQYKDKDKDENKDKERGRGERERERKSMGDYILNPPGQNEKSANYTVHERAVL
jgi:hypothetical protein